jgi:hypothetical protein
LVSGRRTATQLRPRPCVGEAAVDAVDWVFWRWMTRAWEPRSRDLALALGVNHERLWAWCAAFAAMLAASKAARGAAARRSLRCWRSRPEPPGRAPPAQAGAWMPLQWDGLPAHRSNAMRSWLNRQRWWLVVERLPGYAGAEPGRGAVVQPQGGGARQPHRPDPGRGDRPGPPGDRAGPPHPSPGLLASAPPRPVGVMTHQADTQDP